MPLIIQVDGIIGAGKSWYIDNILVPALQQSGYHVVLIKEPVGEWTEILPLFYSDMKRWAYTFQTSAMVSRVQEIKRCLQAHSDNANVVFVSERGVTSDRMFMNILYDEGHVNDIEMKLYGGWWNMWYTHIMVAPTLVIYLNTDLELCQTRIVHRGRLGELTEDGECKIPIGYQAKLKEQHDIKYHNKESVELIPWHDTRIIEITDTTQDPIKWKQDTIELVRELLSKK